jgi:hypothetical protein
MTEVAEDFGFRKIKYFSFVRWGGEGGFLACAMSSWRSM